MKKILILFTIPLLYYSINFNNSDDLIRIRILANSNSKHDQSIKEVISNNLKSKLYELLKNENNIENARKIIKENIYNVEEIVKDNLKDENYSFSINYGLNYFPEKKYKNKKYSAGNYESLLITLGEGKGNNWWCILFPPVCLLEAEESEEVEYNFFIFDFINKIFH